MYLYFFLFRFSKKFSLKFFPNLNNLQKINKKKNIFFKKKYRTKILISKRLSIILRKRKKLKLFKTKKVDKGNFFFKKFFFKTLLKSRKFLKSFFFFNKKTRQVRITRSINFNLSNSLSRNLTYEYILLNVLLRSHLCIFVKDAIYLIKNNFLYLNGKVINKYDTIISEQDIIQFKMSLVLLKYTLFSKKLLKKKIALFRLNSWKFFKQKFFKQKQQLKVKKRKLPKYLYLFYLFKLDVPKFLEVDYLTLSIFFLKKLTIFKSSTYYLNKLFSFKLFSLYNFKKIN